MASGQATLMEARGANRQGELALQSSCARGESAQQTGAAKQLCSRQDKPAPSWSARRKSSSSFSSSSSSSSSSSASSSSLAALTAPENKQKAIPITAIEPLIERGGAPLESTDSEQRKTFVGARSVVLGDARSLSRHFTSADLFNRQPQEVSRSKTPAARPSSSLGSANQFKPQAPTASVATTNSRVRQSALYARRHQYQITSSPSRPATSLEQRRRQQATLATNLHKNQTANAASQAQSRLATPAHQTQASPTRQRKAPSSSSSVARTLCATRTSKSQQLRGAQAAATVTAVSTALSTPQPTANQIIQHRRKQQQLYSARSTLINKTSSKFSLTSSTSSLCLAQVATVKRVKPSHSLATRVDSCVQQTVAAQKSASSISEPRVSKEVSFGSTISRPHAINSFQATRKSPAIGNRCNTLGASSYLASQQRHRSNAVIRAQASKITHLSRSSNPSGNASTPLELRTRGVNKLNAGVIASTTIEHSVINTVSRQPLVQSNRANINKDHIVEDLPQSSSLNTKELVAQNLEESRTSVNSNQRDGGDCCTLPCLASAISDKQEEQKENNLQNQSVAFKERAPTFVDTGEQTSVEALSNNLEICFEAQSVLLHAPQRILNESNMISASDIDSPPLLSIESPSTSSSNNNSSNRRSSTGDLVRNNKMTELKAHQQALPVTNYSHLGTTHSNPNHLAIRSLQSNASTTNKEPLSLNHSSNNEKLGSNSNGIIAKKQINPSCTVSIQTGRQRRRSSGFTGNGKSRIARASIDLQSENLPPTSQNILGLSTSDSNLLDTKSVGSAENDEANDFKIHLQKQQQHLENEESHHELVVRDVVALVVKEQSNNDTSSHDYACDSRSETGSTSSRKTMDYQEEDDEGVVDKDNRIDNDDEDERFSSTLSMQRSQSLGSSLESADEQMVLGSPLVTPPPSELEVEVEENISETVTSASENDEKAVNNQDKDKAAPIVLDLPIKLEPISDNYDLEARPFARGKFAQVKRCINKNSKECFAAKCIKKRRRLVDIRHEILLEIEALKLSFYTDHIVKLYEVYETSSEIILVLELAQGGELQRVLDDEESIEELVAKRMVSQILDGLIRLHDNDIAHLDIKPQNILLTRTYPDGDIKLCDFGISRRITKESEIREICGTPDYVAPEILRYDPISLATDMWSLGVLTYVLLTGYSPFGSENKQQTFCNITQATLDFPSEIFDKISKDAIDFMQRLIVREPSERLTSRQARNHPWLCKQQK